MHSGGVLPVDSVLPLWAGVHRGGYTWELGPLCASQRVSDDLVCAGAW